MPGMMQAPSGAMTIKRKVQTKYKLPTLNWQALKPNQVRGTIFNELDDEKLHKTIDFADFEEKFKIGVGIGALASSELDGLARDFSSKRFKKPENISLLEHTRLRNIGELQRIVGFDETFLCKNKYFCSNFKAKAGNELRNGDKGHKQPGSEDPLVGER